MGVEDLWAFGNGTTPEEGIAKATRANIRRVIYSVQIQLKVVRGTKYEVRRVE